METESSPYHRADRSAADHERAAREALGALRELRSAHRESISKSREHQLLEELSIAGWRTSLHQEAFAACDDLALGHGIPDKIADDARGHLLYYADPIAGATFQKIDAVIEVSGDVPRLSQSRVNAPNWLHAANPVCSPWRPGGTVALVREDVLLKRSQDQWQPVDLHRVVEYDRESEVARVSRPFTFLHWGTERAASLSVDAHAALVTFHVEDERAYACRIPIARLDELLNARVLPSPHSPH